MNSYCLQAHRRMERVNYYWDYFVLKIICDMSQDLQLNGCDVHQISFTVLKLWFYFGEEGTLAMTIRVRRTVNEDAGWETQWWRLLSWNSLDQIHGDNDVIMLMMWLKTQPPFQVSVWITGQIKIFQSFVFCRLFLIAVHLMLHRGR